MKHLVIGEGQIGTAIAEVLRDNPDNEVFTKDIQPMKVHMERAPDVMHVCIPYSNGFVDQVRLYMSQYAPSLTIIHSTVRVGTSTELGAVHSPVTGRHPNLYESIKTFIKFFGGPQSAMAANIFARCGVPVMTTKKSETTEAGKLWQTLQYGWLIMLQKEGFQWMKENGANPNVAYSMMNEEYNHGYNRMGSDFILPVLRDMPGPIGGHCVIPNTEFTEHWMARTLFTRNLRYDDDPNVGNTDPEQAEPSTEVL